MPKITSIMDHLLAAGRVLDKDALKAAGTHLLEHSGGTVERQLVSGARRELIGDIGAGIGRAEKQAVKTEAKGAFNQRRMNRAIDRATAPATPKVSGAPDVRAYKNMDAGNPINKAAVTNGPVSIQAQQTRAAREAMRQRVAANAATSGGYKGSRVGRGNMRGRLNANAPVQVQKSLFDNPNNIGGFGTWGANAEARTTGHSGYINGFGKRNAQTPDVIMGGQQMSQHPLVSRHQAGTIRRTNSGPVSDFSTTPNPKASDKAWHANTKTQKVPASEVPPDIRAKGRPEAPAAAPGQPWSAMGAVHGAREMIGMPAVGPSVPGTVGSWAERGIHHGRQGVNWARENPWKAAGIYAGAAVGMRMANGGTLTRDGDGSPDIVGVPLF